MKFLSFVTNQLVAFDKKVKTHPWVGIIIHHTDVGAREEKEIDETLWKKLQSGISNYLSKKDENYVSAHFQIGRYGETYMIVDPRTHIAYHAGKSSWFHPILRKQVEGWNTYSIGIELLGDGNKIEYSEEQYTALANLCNALMKDFETIDPRCITGHENIAPGRKFDPGSKFKWKYFFSKLRY